MTKTAQELLLENLPLVERIAASLCRRKAMTPDQVEDFSAELKVRLIDNDYAIIRRFAGRSSFATYLAAVAAHVLLDYRIRLWGKWNPSNEAKRLGPVAVALEKLLFRDEQTLEEAATALRERYPDVSQTEIEVFAARLPHRVRRRLVDLDEAAVPVEAPHVLDIESVKVGRRISTIVNEFIDRLPERDQMVFRLRFETSMTTTQIARALHLDVKTLYRRFEGWFAVLRKQLEQAGISARDIDALVGGNSDFLDFKLKERGESSAAEAASSEEQHA
ncbi:MAG TPA: sigma-70 family RNA polymerase sigma factor [Thermoanaerobaculia bacterium]|nr:sigma-70 family RNA polymerase sigma factor [Thermoanaerobaculia bacterium]